jgi:hypothetical protein
MSVSAASDRDNTIATSSQPGRGGFFARLFGSGAGPEGQRRPVRAEDRLMMQSAKQYLIALKSTYLGLRSKSKDPAPAEIWSEIDRILTKYPEDETISDDVAAWDDAHRCERLLVDLYDADRLDVELGRRILEAQKSGLDYADYYAGRQQKPDATSKVLSAEQLTANRSLLSKLIEDQQWQNTKLYLKRGYAHGAQKRVFKAFIVALVIFVAMMFVVFESRNLPQAPGTPPSTQSDSAAPPAPSTGG